MNGRVSKSVALLLLAGTAAGARVLAASKCYPTRYEVQAGGLVLDDTTGLTWEQTVSGNSYTWKDATTYCAGLGPGWRLPSLTEMQTIVDDTTFNPAIDRSAFPNTPSTYFWTSSAQGTAGAWYVFFNSGFTGINDPTLPFRVRCVR
jgi:hypothetical protein